MKLRRAVGVEKEMIAALLVVTICILVVVAFPLLGAALIVIAMVGGSLLAFGLPTIDGAFFAVLFVTLLFAPIFYKIVWPDIKKSRTQKKRSALYPPMKIPDAEVIPTLWALFASGKLTQNTFNQYWSHIPEADPSEKVYYALFADPEYPDDPACISYAIRDGLAVFVNPTDEHLERNIPTRAIKPGELPALSPSTTATAAY